jgi:hypothetical protein
MAIERYCTMKGCEGGDKCQNKYRTDGQPCTMEYVASKERPEYNWVGEGPPPSRWRAADGTIVYRSYADYCD